jgi:hypothetical protein
VLSWFDIAAHPYVALLLAGALGLLALLLLTVVLVRLLALRPRPPRPNRYVTAEELEARRLVSLAAWLKEGPRRAD